MKKLLLLLCSTITTFCFAGTATLMWNAPTGSTVSGYNLYYGTTSNPTTKATIANPVTTAAIVNITSGKTYYFTVTAYNTAGESTHSNQISYLVP